VAIKKGENKEETVGKSMNLKEQKAARDKTMVQQRAPNVVNPNVDGEKALRASHGGKGSARGDKVTRPRFSTWAGLE